jgi:hypothetical protein
MQNQNENFLDEARSFIDEETVNQIFFYCDNENPDGVYVNDADLMEYSEKLIAVVGRSIADAERAECLKIVEALNPEVARVLKDRRG